MAKNLDWDYKGGNYPEIRAPGICSPFVEKGVEALQHGKLSQAYSSSFKRSSVAAGVIKETLRSDVMMRGQTVGFEWRFYERFYGTSLPRS